MPFVLYSWSDFCARLKYFICTLDESTSQPTQEEGFIITTADSRPKGVCVCVCVCVYIQIHVASCNQ